MNKPKKNAAPIKSEINLVAVTRPGTQTGLI